MNFLTKQVLVLKLYNSVAVDLVAEYAHTTTNESKIDSF